MTDREVMQQALAALEYTTSLTNFLLRNEKDIGPMLKANEAITALRTALAMHKVSEFAQAQEQAEPVREPFDDLATELFVVAQISPADDGFSDTIDRIESWLREHFSTPPQQQAEPVAHFGSAYINENGVHITTVLGPVAIPQDAKLYTAPPQRKPLTDEQADQIISGLQTCHHQSSKREFLKVWLRDWAAHGIKEGT